MDSTKIRPKKKSPTRFILLSIVILIIIGYIGSTIDDPAQVTPADSTATSNIKPAESQPKEQENLWNYRTETDNMDNTEMNLASLPAANTLTFKFPYGESSFTLNVRKWKGETSIYISCSECQFLAGIAGEKSYRIKIDSDPPFSVTVNHPSDGSSNTVFLGSPQKIIPRLKTASLLTVEAEFFQEGYQQITFSVKGFQWK